MTRHLAEMTWPEVTDAVAAGATTLILPLGATEQHGPHLPLATDTIRAAALAEQLAEALPDALVAPALPIGCSDEHWGFAGLIGLDHDTLAMVIADCARRVAGWGITRLVLLSAHGGNARALDLAAGRLREERPDLSVVVLGGDATQADAVLAVAADDGVANGAVGLHAGDGETSEILALRPDLVRLARVEPGLTEGPDDLLSQLERNGVRAVTPTGVLGDPRAATAERGHRYLAAETAGYRQALDAQSGNRFEACRG